MDEKTMMRGRDWNGESLKGRLLSEKFDGVCGLWDGHAMWTRSGERVELPEWFSLELPAVRLEGEIWAGRGTFNAVSAAVRFGRIFAGCVFRVFDSPDTFGTRAQRMIHAARICEGSTIALPVETMICEGNKHAIRLMEDVKRGGGEGLMAHSARGNYKPGRSASILKIKKVPMWMINMGVA